MSRILVIRLGALGDFVQSFGPFAAIRARHPEARITLLTTPPFAELARRAPWFDAVAIDTRPSVWNLPALLLLARSLRGFDFVYDLQTSARSSRYFWLAGRPPWSGIAPGCSHPHANPRRDFMHTRERQREQLLMAGVETFPAPDLAWLTRSRGDAGESGIRAALPAAPYAVLVPGASPHRPGKRWPHFPALARRLEARGLVPVVLGSRAETPLAAAIRQGGFVHDRPHRPHHRRRDRERRRQRRSRGRQRHRPDARRGRGRLPVGRAVLGGKRPGSHRAPLPGRRLADGPQRAPPGGPLARQGCGGAAVGP